MYALYILPNELELKVSVHCIYIYIYICTVDISLGHTERLLKGVLCSFLCIHACSYIHSLFKKLVLLSEKLHLYMLFVYACIQI
jgi:hypothetical protein